MNKVIKTFVSLIKDILKQSTLMKVRELLQAHIDSSDRTPYWKEDASEEQNVKNMIRFFEIGFQDGYFSSGKYFDASRWMSSNPDEVIKMYFEIKEEQHEKI